MMRKFIALLALIASPAIAQDFSANSNAKPWNLYAEVPATFDARVVDVMCELTGDCPAKCGDGDRQLALLRKADDIMVMVLKNNQPAFTGAVVDLLPYCGQDITVDGLMIEDEDFPIKNIYLVQRIKAGEADWTKASQWTKVWAAENPEAKGKGAWYRRHPAVLERIAAEGYLGLGLETDAEFIEYLFE